MCVFVFHCVLCVPAHIEFLFILNRPQDPRMRVPGFKTVRFPSGWSAHSVEEGNSKAQGDSKTSSGKKEKLLECTKEMPLDFMPSNMREYARELGIKNLKKKISRKAKAGGLQAPFYLSEEKVYWGGKDLEPQAYQFKDDYTPEKQKRPEESGPTQDNKKRPKKQ